MRAGERGQRVLAGDPDSGRLLFLGLGLCDLGSGFGEHLQQLRLFAPHLLVGGVELDVLLVERRFFLLLALAALFGILAIHHPLSVGPGLHEEKVVHAGVGGGPLAVARGGRGLGVFRIVVFTYVFFVVVGVIRVFHHRNRRRGLEYGARRGLFQFTEPAAVRIGVPRSPGRRRDVRVFGEAVLGEFGAQIFGGISNVTLENVCVLGLARKVFKERDDGLFKHAPGTGWGVVQVEEEFEADRQTAEEAEHPFGLAKVHLSGVGESQQQDRLGFACGEVAHVEQAAEACGAAAGPVEELTSLGVVKVDHCAALRIVGQEGQESGAKRLNVFGGEGPLSGQRIERQQEAIVKDPPFLVPERNQALCGGGNVALSVCHKGLRVGFFQNEVRHFLHCFVVRGTVLGGNRIFHRLEDGLAQVVVTHAASNGRSLGRENIHGGDDVIVSLVAGGCCWL